MKDLKLLLIFTTVSILVSTSCGLTANNNNKKQNPLQELFRLAGQQKQQQSSFTPLPTREDGDRFLRGLNLTASTTPATFQAPVNAVPALLACSLPALFRFGSGVFGYNYRLNLIKVSEDAANDDTDYSFLQLGNFQTQETSTCNIPELPLILYETADSSPACRAIREACSMLSLQLTIRPCTRPRGQRFLADIQREYGGKQLPLLIDPNTGREIANDAPAVIAYLFQKYSGGDNDQQSSLSSSPTTIPWTLSNPIFVWSTSVVGLNLARLLLATTNTVAVPPQVVPNIQPLILWAYEGSPFCYLVQHFLNDMGLEHTIKYTPRGSPNRKVFLQQQQQCRFQVPCLQDPNTGVVLLESLAIVEYIQKVYGRNVPVKYM